MYDIKSRIEKMHDQYPNTIQVLGGAYFAIDHTDNFADFVLYIPNVISNAKFYNYHLSPAQACRTFCHLCLVDPMLVEVYLGMTFEELATH